MTAAYWEIGRRIVEIEQQVKERADYGKELLKRSPVEKYFERESGPLVRFRCA